MKIHYLNLDLWVKVTQDFPSTLYIMRPTQIKKFEVATSDCLGIDAFTKKTLFDC